jgi:hypothetical protein
LVYNGLDDRWGRSLVDGRGSGVGWRSIALGHGDILDNGLDDDVGVVDLSGVFMAVTITLRAGSDGANNGSDGERVTHVDSYGDGVVW